MLLWNRMMGGAEWLQGRCGGFMLIVALQIAGLLD